MKEFVDRVGNFVVGTPSGDNVVPIFGAEALRLFLKDAREQFRDEPAPLSMATLAKFQVDGHLLTPTEQKAAEALSTALLRKRVAPVEKKKARKPEKKSKQTQQGETEENDMAIARLFV